MPQRTLTRLVCGLTAAGAIAAGGADGAQAAIATCGGLGVRLRVVTGDYFAEPDPRITARVSLTTYDDGSSPTQIVRTPERPVDSSGLLTRPTCTLTDRSAPPGVSTSALTVRQLIATGVTISLPLCPGETLEGSCG